MRKSCTVFLFAAFLYAALTGLAVAGRDGDLAMVTGSPPVRSLEGRLNAAAEESGPLSATDPADFYIKAMNECALLLGNAVPRSVEDRDLIALGRRGVAAHERAMEELARWKRAVRQERKELAPSSFAAFSRLVQEVRQALRDDIESAEEASSSETVFARIMVAEHQGAADLAKVMLIFEDDPELRSLLARIVAERESEKRSMLAWLSENDTGRTRF